MRLQLVAATAVSGLAVAALVAAGSGTLAGPPIDGWGAAEAWYGQAGAGPAALAGLRVVALIGAAWLLVASVLQLLASLSPAGALQQVADAVSPRFLSRLAQGVAGLSITVGLAGPPVPADPAGTAVMEVLEDEPAPATSTTAPPAAPAPVPVPAPAPVPAPEAEEEVVVAAGDSFWSLAEAVVADHPDLAPVDGYWRRLVAANRARLVDPSNPDLLYPGQVLILPPLRG